jgi:citrate lyase subunit beta/citryl-CoA lyase
MRSLLFVPADSERKIARALASGADVVILDLEDSVAPAAKPAARRLAAEALERGRPSSPLLYVRVNDLSSGLTAADLEAVMPAKPDGLMQPKAAGGRDVRRLSEMAGSPLPIIAIVTETAASLFEVGTYREAGSALQGMAWGAEDLSNDLGARSSRDEEGRLTEPYRLARTLCLAGARAAGVEPVDTVYVDFRDALGLEAECRAAVRDGFAAKMAIHPDQVAIINRAFTPSPEAVAEAQAVVEAFAAAGEAGVVAIGGRMFDIPHLKRAEKLLARAGIAEGRKA